jgi:hypothetical protein
VKLPDDCPYASLSEFDLENEVNVARCCRAARPYRIVAPDEPPLCCSRREETEAYRFFWDSSFNVDAVVHIVR